MIVVALTGLLGYGYTKEGLKNALAMNPDFIGVDAGSTDPGPYYLGSGKSFTSREAVKRDLEEVLPRAVKSKIPLIIGSAGGSGSREHVKIVHEIIKEIAAEKKLKFKLALIYSDVDKAYLRKKFKNGEIIKMGSQLDISEEEIEASTRIVSQIGAESFIKALDMGADVVLAGRACDTAIYAAPCIRAGIDSGLAYHMAKIMECGSMCASPMSASDVMVGEINEDYFELTPANSKRKCIVRNVAAHTLYEQTNPYYIYEPDGRANLKDSVYTQINDRTVRVSKSRFEPAEHKTLKIEGVKLVGYRAFALGGINDPETIRNLNSIIKDTKELVYENTKAKIDKQKYDIKVIKYGVSDDCSTFESTVGIVIDVIGDTQEIAESICALMRSKLLHYDYEGRKSTAGNIAFPYSPSDFNAGPVYEFNIYHLTKIDDLLETSIFDYQEIGEDK